MKELESMSQGWMEQKKPLTTDDEKAYGKNYNPAPKAKKNNTTPKENKSYGSAQQTAMKPSNVACKYK